MKDKRPCVVLLAAVAGVMGLLAACGDDASPVVSPTASAAASPTVVATARPSPALSAEEYDQTLKADWAKPRFEGSLAGIELVSGEHWAAQGNSACASRSLEAPYYGPEAFSLRPAELQLALFGKVTFTRVCKDASVTAILYGGDAPTVILTDSPQNWSINAPADRVSTVTVKGRTAVLVSPIVPGQSQDGELLIAAPFGLLVIFRAPTAEAAIGVAEALDVDSLTVPKGKEPLTGMFNGIRFYDRENSIEPAPACKNGGYGIESPTVPAAASPGSPLNVAASYLPAGYSLQTSRVVLCGGSVYASVTDISKLGGSANLYLVRIEGETAWDSAFSEDWYTATTIAGRPAVIRQAPEWARTEPGGDVLVKEDFGLTMLAGSLSIDELTRVAAALNR